MISKLKFVFAFLLAFCLVPSAFAVVLEYEFGLDSANLSYSLRPFNSNTNNDNTEIFVDRQISANDQLIVRIDTVQGNIDFAGRFFGQTDITNCFSASGGCDSSAALNQVAEQPVVLSTRLYGSEDAVSDAAGINAALTGHELLPDFASYSSVDTDALRASNDRRGFSEAAFNNQVDLIENYQNNITPLDFKLYEAQLPNSLNQPSLINTDNSAYGIARETTGVDHFLALGDFSFGDIFANFANRPTGFTSVSYSFDPTGAFFRSGSFFPFESSNISSFNISGLGSATSEVPEPASLLLLGVGLAFRKRSKKS